MSHNISKDLKNFQYHVLGMQIDGPNEIIVCDCCDLNKLKRKNIPEDPEHELHQRWRLFIEKFGVQSPPLRVH